MATQFAPLESAGSWKLDGGQAVTLQDTHCAVLRITQGRVWATVDGPHTGPGNNRGDLVLTAGERLTLQAGQRVVIEPWSASASESVYFSWDTAAASGAVTATASATGTAPVPLPPCASAGSRMRQALVCPLRDFGLALRMAAQALGRLTWGLGGYLADVGEFLTAGRGRVQPCMESNQP